MNVTRSTLNLLEFYESSFLGVLVSPGGVGNGWGGMELDRRVEMEWHPCQVCWANTSKIKLFAMLCEVLTHIRGCLRTQTK